jgi:predicted GNAT family acetyltransferase
MSTQVVDNREASRFELRIEGHLAAAAYERSGDRNVFTHTIVPPELEGRGIGSRLVKAALDQVRAEGLKVVAQCPFVRAYIERHPEAQDLLA